MVMDIPNEPEPSNYKEDLFLDVCKHPIKAFYGLELHYCSYWSFCTRTFIKIIPYMALVEKLKAIK